MSEHDDALFAAVDREAELTPEQRIEGIKQAIAAGADINARRDYGLTALHDAVSPPYRASLPLPDLDVVRFLIELGADVNAVSSAGNRPLNSAVASNFADPENKIARSLEVMEVLQDTGARVNDGTSLASFSCCHPTMFEALLKVFPDPRATDDKGNTALHAVVVTQQVALIERLLELDIDLDAVNDMGKTPLGLAYAHKGYTDEQKATRQQVIELLEARGAHKKAKIKASADTTPCDVDALHAALETSVVSDASVKSFLSGDFDTYQEMMGQLKNNLMVPEQSLPALLICKAVLGEGKTRILKGDQKIGIPFFHHGDLVIEGHLRIVAPFGVTGDLRVSGCVGDCGPDSFVVIGGDVTLDSLHTSGEFHVEGDINATNVVYGYYNDNVLAAATIRGRLVIEDDHCTDATVEAGQHYPMDVYRQGRGEWVAEALQMLLVPEVFREDDPERIDQDRLFARLHAGEKVFAVD